MKLRHLILSLCAMLLLNACNIEQLEPVGTSSTFDFTLDATMGDFEADDDTKASVTSVIRLSWKAGDEISVINLSTGKALGGSLVADKAGSNTTFSGTLTGTVRAGDKLAFLYPSQGYAEEVDYEPVTVDFSQQLGSVKDNVPICVYSTVTAGSGSSFSHTSASFTFLMSYIQLSLANLETSALIDHVTIENIGNSITINLNGNDLSAVPTIGDITLTPENYKTSSSGTKTIYLTIAASSKVSSRPVTVETANELKSMSWSGSALNQNTSYTSILASFESVPDSEGPGDYNPGVYEIELASASRIPYICDPVSLTYDWSQFSNSILEVFGISYNRFVNDFHIVTDSSLNPIMYVKSGSDYQPSTNLGTVTYQADNITAESPALTWSLYPLSIGIGQSQRIYVRYTNGEGADVYVALSTTVAPKASYTYGIKIANEWYDDIDGEHKNTGRINVLVPIANKTSPVTGGDVTKFSRELNHYLRGYVPSLTLTDDSDPIYQEIASNQSSIASKNSIEASVIYKFSDAQPKIGDIQLVTDEDGSSLYAAAYDSSNRILVDAYRKPLLLQENLVAYFEDDGSTITYNWSTGETVAKKLLNMWSYWETRQDRMMYANVDVEISYGECGIPAGSDHFHVRFMRPVDISIQETEMEGGYASVSASITSIVDWNHQYVVKSSSTGQGLENNVIKTVDMWKFYQFDSMQLHLEDATCRTSSGYQRLSQMNDITLELVTKNGDSYVTSTARTIDIRNGIDVLDSWYLHLDDPSLSLVGEIIYIPVDIHHAWGTLSYTMQTRVVSLEPADGTVHVIQEKGTNLDLVIMGDGFIKEDIADGTYDSIMNQAISEFFSVEPLKSFKELFNVYYVDVVSPQRLEAINTGLNGATNSGNTTALSVQFTENSTSITGDHDLVREYAKLAFKTDANSRIRKATIVVMANQECRAGTCHNSWYTSVTSDYGEACAVAYCALGTSAEERRQLMHHEICGHGFGKLGDEYYYGQYYPTPTGVWDKVISYHNIGLDRNIDIYVDEESHANYPSYPITTTSNVLWHDMFGTANSYESTEGLGIFEGANTVARDFCRPTEDGNQSIMFNNTGSFNAISRRQIFYRIRALSGLTQGTFFSTEELNAFLKWDKENFTNTGSASVRVPDKSIQTFVIAPPVNHIGRWVNGVFIED